MEVDGRMQHFSVGWRITVQWVAGNWACKAFLFLRAFGLYLSSNVLVCVSLDRYFAVLHPLKVNDARRRGKLMLAWAWSVSLIYAVPQSVVFHVAPHPHFPSFKQCVTFGFFTSAKQEIAYNLFCVIAMYFVPLLVIVVAYTAILCEISNKSKDSGGENYQTSNGRMRLRRSDISNIERARTRTLRMTITIVVVFVICWTPYVVMTLWYMFDRDSAEQVPTWLQDALFMMAVSNSCMNPLVYGSYAINFRRECCKCLSCFRSNSSQNNFANGQTVFSAGQGVRISKRLLKCARSIRTVGSGVTRSTGMMHGVGNRSPIVRPDNQLVGLLPKRTRGLTERPPSVGHISFLSEPLASRGYRTSFHSEPCPCPDNAGENSQHSQSSQGTVPPDIL